MVFFIALVLAFFMFMVFKKYRSTRSVVIGIASLFLVTTAFLVWGLVILLKAPAIPLFNQYLDSRVFYHLMGLWYGADIFCSLLILRSLAAYRRINTPSPRKG